MLGREQHRGLRDHTSGDIPCAGDQKRPLLKVMFMGTHRMRKIVSAEEEREVL